MLYFIINLLTHIFNVIFKKKISILNIENLELPSSITPFIGTEFLGVLEVLFHNFRAEKFALET